MYEVVSSISGELVGIRERVAGKYKIKAGENIKDFAHLADNHNGEYIFPALVLCSASLYTELNSEIVALAEVCQLVYLASSIHRCVDDNDECQYAVLVGDYLYSKFSSALVEAGIDRFLGEFSEIICSINEGSILRLKNLDNGGIIKPGLLKRIVRMETAELAAGCCRMSGELAGASGEQQKGLYRFGLSIGMIHGLLMLKRYDQAIFYVEEMRSSLEALLPGQDRENLRDLALGIINCSMPWNQKVG